MITDKLDLLSKANLFKITKRNDKAYDVEFKDANAMVAASIDEDGNAEYYVTGCYNSGADWLEINMNELAELKAFVKFLIDDVW